MKKPIIYAILTSLILALIAFVIYKQFAPQKNNEEYSFINLSGEKLVFIKLNHQIQIIQKDKQFPNQKPSLLLFIYPSCSKCLEGIEHLKRLIDEYKNQVNIFPILLDSQSDLETFKNEVLTMNETYKLNFYFSNTPQDFLATFNRQEEGNFIVLYDKNLRLITDYEGFVPEEMIEFDINRLLKNGENNV